MEEKLFENWEQLENSIRICKDCKLCQNRNKVVIGEGNKNAKIMFIGEGPGADEDIQGRPFVGRAGKLMDQAFKGIGIKREEVYIANVVKCRPPGNRNPEIDEMNACKKFLKSQIKLVNPEIIILLGSVATKEILGEEYSITKIRGTIIEKDGRIYLPTFHPAALLRDEDKKILFWKDLTKIPKEELKFKPKFSNQ